METRTLNDGDCVAKLQGFASIDTLFEVLPTTLNGVIDNAEYHCVYSGAGMSLAAGIPTFRGTSGLWVMPKELLYAATFAIVTFVILHFFLLMAGLWLIVLIELLLFLVTIGAVVIRVLYEVKVLRTPFENVSIVIFIKNTYCWLITGAIWNTKYRWLIWHLYNLTLHRHIVAAQPTSGHRFFAALSKETDVWVITQNVDELERKAGMDPGHVIQLHGSAGTLMCLGGAREEKPWLISDRRETMCMEYTDIMDRTTGQIRALGCPNSTQCPKCGRSDAMRTGCLLFDDGHRRRPDEENDKMSFVAPLFQCIRVDRDAEYGSDVIRRYDPGNSVFWMIGTSNQVNSSWRALSRIRGATVIEINPDPDPKFVDLALKHNYYHLQEKQEVVFDKLARGEIVSLPDMASVLAGRGPELPLVRPAVFRYEEWKAKLALEPSGPPPKSAMCEMDEY